MEKICRQCGTKATTKWFSGPLCRRCYRAQPHIKAKEKASRAAKADYYRSYWKERNSTAAQRLYNKQRNAAYYAAHKEQRLEKTRRYRAANPSSSNIYARRYAATRRLNDLNFRLRCCLRSRLSHALQAAQSGGSAVKDLGCSIEELKLHLERLWQPGMSWDNYGRKGWHIDHVIPLSSFDLSDPEQAAAACHYTNLQPLWWGDNLSKGSKR